MNTENSITNESNKFSYYFTKKLNLKDPNKNIALVNLSIYNNITAYNNNKLKISASTWNDLFDLPDGSYSYVIYKVVLNALLQNMRLQQIICPCKFTSK